jgi:hypothetical protein
VAQLTFTIAADTKDLDDGKEHQEYRDPDGNIEIRPPESDSNTSSSEFERQNCQPADRIIPADSESPEVAISNSSMVKSNGYTYRDGSTNLTI